MILAQAGSGLLLAALALTSFAAATSLWGARGGDPMLGWVGRRAFSASAGCVAAASAVLLAALLGHDFSLAFVAEHTDRAMPASLVAAAFYGGQEGSLLYWALVLSVLGAVSLAPVGLPASLRAYATAVMAAILGFFLVVLVFVASPFQALRPVPSDGLGLNPLLRDSGMLIHPPFLLAGFSSFAIPFAFAIAALLDRRWDAGWLHRTRTLALLAWGLQTVGLALGAWWAYHVLGWGGYWGWDPVENLALLPWLASTAYVHSVQVQERRGTLSAWNFGLAIVSYLLAILGTFIVRSGVIQSVHSFAVSSIGPWLLAFLVVSVAVSGLVLVARLPLLRTQPAVESPASREGAFLLNNLLFLAIAFAVLWGTLLPLGSGLTTGRQQVVGPSFYERTTGPLLLALVALLAVGPLLPWRRGGNRWLSNLRAPGLMALGALVALLAAGVRDVPPLLAGPVLAAAATTCMMEFVRGGRFASRLPGSWPAAAARLAVRNRRRYCAYLAHLGLVIAATGIAASHFWQQERQVVLQPGQRVVVGTYQLTYVGTETAPAADAVVYTGELRLGDERVEPRRFVYPSLGQQARSEVAIRSTPLEDLYVVLAGINPDGSAAFLVFLNPLVTWVWLGAGLLVYAVWLGNAGSAPRLPAPAASRERIPALGVGR